MLHENLRLKRKERGLSQEELASRLHVVRQTISKWEKGVVYQMLEKVTVLADNRIKVTFRNGVEIEQTVDQPKRRKFA